MVTRVIAETIITSKISFLSKLNDSLLGNKFAELLCLL